MLRMATTLSPTLELFTSGPTCSTSPATSVPIPMKKKRFLDFRNEIYAKENVPYSQRKCFYFYLHGIQGNLNGKKGRNMPFCTFQSTGFILTASIFNKISPLLGLGIGT